MCHERYLTNVVRFSPEHSPLRLLETLLGPGGGLGNLAALNTFHFYPYAPRCRLCRHARRVDAIIEFETFAEDVKFVAGLLNVTVGAEKKKH